MEVEITSPELYKTKIIPKYIFNTVDFCEINTYKVDSILYLFLKEGNKIRFGICIGKKNNEFLCPFSAPFGIIESVKDSFDTQVLENAIIAFDKFCEEQKLSNVRFILPPMIYNESYISLLLNILLRNNYQIKFHDLNFHINSTDNLENYLKKIPRNGKKNLRISIDSNLDFHICKNMLEVEEAYKIIAINRSEKGYPLKMNFEQVSETIKVIPHDFFLVSRKGINIAAAQVFYVTGQIVQVIYWGDISGYSEFKPVNFLSYNLLKYYEEKGISCIDIGPSTEFGQPNYGLCNFKISIGCEVSSKFTLEKRFY